MKSLIICEKPSLAKTVAKALNVTENKKLYFESENYIVTYAFGHLLRLKSIDEYLGEKKAWNQVELPYIPQSFQYVASSNEESIKRQIKVIMDLMNRNDVSTIINCGDADREGQVIIDNIIHLSKTKKSIKRLWLPEQTEETIQNQIRIAKDNQEYQHLYKEGIARMYLDWLLGINLTRFITNTVGNLYPVGRVMIPIVQEIYDREMMIKNFIEETYYQVENNTPIKLVDKLKFKDKIAAEKRMNELNQFGVATVIKEELKEIERNPKKLFSLSTLQSKLSSEYKIDFNTSLETIQKLYERGYVTYPRTNTEYLAENEFEKVNNILLKLNQDDLANSKVKRIYDNSKIESHSAITITTVFPEEQELDEKEKIVYGVIKARFLSNFCKDKTIIAKTKLEISVGKTAFLIEGEKLIQTGHFKYEKQNIKSEIPNLKLNDQFSIHFEVLSKKTTPPKRHTEETLSNFLKNPFRKKIENGNDEELYQDILKGIEIGTEATRTGIIDKIIKLQYISKKKQSFYLEEKGKHLIQYLEKCNIQLDKNKTVEFSEMLKQVYQNKLSVDGVISAAKKELEEICNQEIKEIKKEERYPSIGKCIHCHHDVLEKTKVFQCSNPDCKFAIWKNNSFLLEKKIKPTAKLISKLLVGEAKIKFYSKNTNKEYKASLQMEYKDPFVNFKIRFN